MTRECMAYSRAGETVDLFTDQDREILALLVECANDGTVARRLSISVRTVRRRTARIMEIMEAKNRFAAGVAAERLGLLPGPPPAVDSGLLRPLRFGELHRLSEVRVPARV